MEREKERNSPRGPAYVQKSENILKRGLFFFLTGGGFTYKKEGVFCLCGLKYKKPLCRGGHLRERERRKVYKMILSPLVCLV